MNNIDRWRLINRENPSPANFIDAGFFYMIGSALQRRSWEGTEDRKPLFFNQYIVMVAPPGVGKSWVMDEVKSTLALLIKEPGAHDAIKVNKRALASDLTACLNHQDEDAADYVLNFSADATSYEALVRSLANSSTWKQAPSGKMYHYAAMSGIIDEFTSLFNKDSELTKDFLLSVFGCGTYRKDTIKHGLQIVSNPYFCLLAGTTPERIIKTKEIDILDDGFAARTIFLYAQANRFEPPIEIPALDAQQAVAKSKLVEHFYALSKVYGGLLLSREAVEWLTNPDNRKRTNSSPLLDHYYARRIVHIKKLAGLVAFSDTAEPGEISLTCVQTAVMILNRWEAMMHNCFTGKGLNELSPTATRIVTACALQSLSLGHILSMFYHDVNGPQLDVLINDLVKQGRLRKASNGKYEKA